MDGVNREPPRRKRGQGERRLEEGKHSIREQYSDPPTSEGEEKVTWRRMFSEHEIKLDQPEICHKLTVTTINTKYHPLRTNSTVE